jgi:hypothetical protein
MKKKAFRKKLSLNKLTVANLKENLMGNFMGGVPPKSRECPYTLDPRDPVCISYIECDCSEWLTCVNTENPSCLM